jgi:CheY-like chemotaxis protein
MRILICDNNPIIIMDLEGVLQDLGYICCGSAASLNAGLELAEATRPDLAFVDLTLNDGETGLVLVEALAAMGIPSVIVSAEANSAPPHLPVAGRVEKPFTAKTIAHAMRTLSFSEAITGQELPGGWSPRALGWGRRGAEAEARREVSIAPRVSRPRAKNNGAMRTVPSFRSRRALAITSSSVLLTRTSETGPWN